MKNDEEKWRLPSVGWSWVAIEIDDSGVGVRGFRLGLKGRVAGEAVILKYLTEGPCAASLLKSHGSLRSSRATAASF